MNIERFGTLSFLQVRIDSSKETCPQELLGLAVERFLRLGATPTHKEDLYKPVLSMKTGHTNSNTGICLTAVLQHRPEGHQMD